MKNFIFAVLAFLALPAFASDWEAQAQSDLASPGGKQYEMAAAKFSASILGQVMSTCVKSSPSPFKVYLMVSSGGVITASSVSPVSPLANCFAAELGKSTWPKPSFAPFVYRMEMFGNPAEFGR
jgi:hypothetical protein